MEGESGRALQAFQLARKGVERAVWAVPSSPTGYNAIKAGTVIKGYCWDTVYQDAENGVYRVNLSSGPTASEITITAEGRDAVVKEVRAIQVVYEVTEAPSIDLTKKTWTEIGPSSVAWP